MALLWTSSGCNETSACMSSGFSIPTMLVKPSDMQAGAWRFCSRSLWISTQTRNINWQTGASGKFKRISVRQQANSDLPSPLPEEMFYYARSDTHYLLYIYDMLRNELAELSRQTHPDGNPIDRVLQKSKEVSLQRYEHLLCDPETGAGGRGWFNTLIKSPALYNGEQFAVYKAVHKWRDDLARREDESPPFIMSQQVLSDIARILPTDKKALWSLLDSNSRGLRAHLDELFDVIQEGRAKGANGPTMMEFFRQCSGTPARNGLGGKGVHAGIEVDSEPLDIQELRSERSQFWGGMAPSSAWDGSAKTPPPDDRVEIPLVYYGSDQYAFGTDKPEEESPKVAEPPAPRGDRQTESDAAAEDPVFTLRTGRKRKASDANIEPGPDAAPASNAEADNSPAAEQPETATSDDAEARKLAKKQARKARKAELKRAKRAVEELVKQGDTEAAKELAKEAKKARKAAKKAARKQQQQQQQSDSGGALDDEEVGEDDNEEEEGEDDQPFDYTKAESVLHAAKTANGNENSDKAAAAFDPYAARTGNAPQGARKLNYEKAGRTATFKK